MSSLDLPDLYCRDSPLNTYVLSKCKLSERPFTPSIFLSNKHIQSLLPVILPTPDIEFEREYLQMKDKGVVALDWVTNPQPKIKRKRCSVLLIIPALTDGALNVSNMCQSAVSRCMKVVVFNCRGDGGSVLTTPKIQSFGDPSDLRQVIKYLRLLFPRASIAAIAYGTGCGLLMSYLGEFGSSSLLTAGACISPCYDVPVRLSTISNPYDLLLLLRLKYNLLRHAQALSTVLDVDKAAAAWNFSDLHQSLFFPLYGYRDIEQFWEMNNPIRDVDDIEVPILCINSLDDPTCPFTDIPYDLFKYYPNFLLAVTNKGGHCGFYEGFPPTSWVESLCLDYIEAVVEFTYKQSKNTTQQQKQQWTRNHTLSESGVSFKTTAEQYLNRSRSRQNCVGTTSRGNNSNGRCRSSVSRFTI